MAGIAVVVNPTAGRGAGARLAPQVEHWLREYGLDFELKTTTRPGHATILAREAAELKYKAVIAVGGDGTANEVLNGLVDPAKGPEVPALGILPIGTGNDFAFGAGLPMNLQDACQVIVRGDTRTIDVGWVRADNEDERWFGNGVGIGFDAIVNIESRKIRRLRGFLLYLVAVIKTLLLYYHAPQLEIRLDDTEIVQLSLMVSIMNGVRFGGGFMVAPGAHMGDGVFDVCITGQMPRLEMAACVPRFIRGTHVTHEQVTMSQGQAVTVVSETPWASHVDGEIYGVGSRRYETRLSPQCLRLLC